MISPKKPKSKKWARRRKITIMLRGSNGWHKSAKIKRLDWEMMERAAIITGETMEEFIIHSLEVELARMANE